MIFYFKVILFVHTKKAYGEM